MHVPGETLAAVHADRHATGNVDHLRMQPHGKTGHVLRAHHDGVAERLTASIVAPGSFERRCSSRQPSKVPSPRVTNSSYSIVPLLVSLSVSQRLCVTGYEHDGRNPSGEASATWRKYGLRRKSALSLKNSAIFGRP